MTRVLLGLLAAAVAVLLAGLLLRRDAPRDVASQNAAATPGQPNDGVKLAQPTDAPRVAAGSGAAAPESLAPVSIELVESDKRSAAEVEVVLVPSAGGLVPGKTDRKGRLDFDLTVEGGLLFVRRVAAQPWRSPEPLGRGRHVIALPVGEEVSGRLVVNGEPPGERIRLKLVSAIEGFHTGLSEGDRRELQRALPWPELETAPDGVFRFLGLAPGAKGTLRIPTGWRLSGREKAFQFVAPAVGLVIELVPELRGRIVDAQTGAPVAHATVEAVVTSSPGLRATASALSDSEGRFGVGVPAGAPAKVQNVQISATDAEGLRSGSATFDGEDIPESLDLGDIAVRGSGGVDFRVRTTEGEPIAGVRGRIENTGGRPRDMPPTDAQGRGRFPAIPEDATGLRFLARSYKLARLPVPAPGVSEIEVTLQRCNRLEVHVLGPQKWIERCKLRLTARSGRLWEGLDPQEGPLRQHGGGSSSYGSIIEGGVVRPVWNAQLDAQGRCVLEELALVALSVEVLDPANVVLHAESLPPLGPEEVRILTVPLSDGLGWVSGRVSAVDGSTIAGAGVMVPLTGPGMTVGVRTQADGSFWIGPFAHAAVDLQVSAADKGFAPRLLQHVATRGGQEVAVVLERGLAFAVAARDESGAPVDGGRLSLVPPDGMRLHVRRTGTGTWEVLHAPPGLLRAQLELGGRIYAREHDPREGDLAFDVPVHGSVEATWAPLAPGNVALRLVGAELGIDFSTDVSAGEGSSVAPAVLPGRYQACLRRLDPLNETWRDLTGSVDVLVEPGRKTQIRLGP